MQRLKVFVDYQNVYKLAREAFLPFHAPSRSGSIHPDLAGVLLETKRRAEYRGTQFDAELREVRVYRGMPDGALDAKGHGACSRQIAFWERHPDIRAFTHPIAYPRGWENEWDRPGIVQRGEKPREKGIDVQIAVDLVLGAINDEYDVAVVFSGDSDLLPAIRAVFSIGKHVEVAAWWPENQPGTRIPPRDLPAHPNGKPRTSLWCHRLDVADFRFMRDDTDYTRPA